MSDQDVATRIEQLVNEEHELRSREENAHENERLLDEERLRLAAVKVDLDRCWDLLRQRRALRDAGEDPDYAQVRDAHTVEHYRQ